MKVLPRRDVLRGLAGMSAMGVLGPLGSSIGCYNDGPITLNIILHGLFVIDIKDDGIDLLTPDTPGHIYRYGNWREEDIYHLDQEKTWEFVGLPEHNPVPNPTDPHGVVLSKSNANCKFTVKAENSKTVVKLRHPSRIEFLRRVGTGGLPQCSSATHGYIVKVENLSLCQVLVYESVDPRQLQIKKSGWVPWVYPKGVANLHFWAEPEKRLTPAHAHIAYKSLSQLLDPLYFILSVEKSAPVELQPNVKGLPPEQQQGWSEWASGGGEGTHPTNCCAVITKK